MWTAVHWMIIIVFHRVRCLLCHKHFVLRFICKQNPNCDKCAPSALYCRKQNGFLSLSVCVSLFMRYNQSIWRCVRAKTHPLHKNKHTYTESVEVNSFCTYVRSLLEFYIIRAWNIETIPLALRLVRLTWGCFSIFSVLFRFVRTHCSLNWSMSSLRIQRKEIYSVWIVL